MLTDDVQDEPVSEPAPRKPDSALRLSGRRELEVIAETVTGQTAPPERLGQYEVTKRLGRGAFGEVYLGYDAELHRPAALKLLRGAAGPDAKARLRKEAQAMAALNHPALLTVYGFGEFEGRVFIAMEYAEHGTMRDWIRQARSTDEIVQQVAHAARGLHAAHQAGLVHRDVKPSNILIGNDGRARVSDFGLVYAEASLPTLTSSGSGSAQTAMGGTPPYMSPELFDPSPPTPRSDEFALCITLYELLFDARPNWQQTIIDGVEVPSTRPRPKAPTPGWLRDVLIRGLKTDPNERYASLAELAKVLDEGRGRRARRQRLVGAAVVVSIAAGLGWTARSSNAEAPCTTAESSLAGVWDQPRAAAIRSAIGNSELSFTDATWTTVKQTLDEYAARWVDAHQDTCAATEIRHERSPQLMDKAMACLERRKRQLAAFVGVLERGDAATIASAPLGATQLQHVSECTDLERLLSAAPPPPPERADAVATLGRTVADADALRQAGSVSDAAAMLDTVESLIETTDYEPLRQQYRFARASLASNRRQPEGEMSALLAAFASASRSGRRDDASKAAQRLAVALAWAGDYDAGARWITVAEAATDPSDGAVANARLEMGRGTVTLLRGDPHQASRHYQAAVTLLTKAFGPNDIRLIPALRNLGNAQQDDGDYHRAQQTWEHALQLTTARLGPRHPEAATLIGNLAFLACELGQPDRGGQLAQQALEIEEQTYGANHPSVADALSVVARAARDLGHLQQSHTLLVRADAIYASSPDTAANSARTAALDGLSDLALTRGDIAASAAYAERSVELSRASLPADHPDLAAALSNLARVRSMQGRAAESLAGATEADEILLRRFGPDHPLRIDVLGVRSGALLYLDRYAEAIVASETQLRLVTEQLGADHPERAPALYNLALSHAAQHDYDDAERRYRESLAVLETEGATDDPGLAYPLVGLARTLTATGRATEAIAPLQRALVVAQGHAQLTADALDALARALVLSDGDRKRAARYAADAATKYGSLGGPADQALEQLNAFRAEHGLE